MNIPLFVGSIVMLIIAFSWTTYARHRTSQIVQTTNQYKEQRRAKEASRKWETAHTPDVRIRRRQHKATTLAPSYYTQH